MAFRIKVDINLTHIRIYKMYRTRLLIFEITIVKKNNKLTERKVTFILLLGINRITDILVYFVKLKK